MGPRANAEASASGAGKTQKKRNSRHGKSHTSSPATSAALSDHLLPLGKRMQPTPSDGNCLFSAIASSLHSHRLSMDDAEDVRAKITRELLKHRGLYDCFFTPADNNQEHADVDYEDVQDQTWEDYVERMQKDSEWGGQIEMLAASQVYKRPVKVFVVDSGNEVSVNVIEHKRERARAIEVAFDGIAHYVGVVNLSQRASSETEEEEEEEEDAGSTDEEGGGAAVNKRPTTPEPPKKKTDPCHCGSGKKYMKCCMKVDQARVRARARVAKAKKSAERQRRKEEEEEEEAGSTDEDVAGSFARLKT